MASIGAKIRWKNGDIIHPSRMWQSPSKRRLPRTLIEDRALQVVLLVYIEDPSLVFHETNADSSKADTKDAIQLELYLNRFFLLPHKIKRQDAYEWLKRSENAILLWGQKDSNTYYVKPVRKRDFIK